jgi:hypothetical protein
MCIFLIITQIINPYIADSVEGYRVIYIDSTGKDSMASVSLDSPILFVDTTAWNWQITYPETIYVLGEHIKVLVLYPPYPKIIKRKLGRLR